MRIRYFVSFSGFFHDFKFLLLSCNEPCCFLCIFLPLTEVLFALVSVLKELVEQLISAMSRVPHLCNSLTCFLIQKHPANCNKFDNSCGNLKVNKITHLVAASPYSSEKNPQPCTFYIKSLSNQIGVRGFISM